MGAFTPAYWRPRTEPGVSRTPYNLGGSLRTFCAAVLSHSLTPTRLSAFLCAAAVLGLSKQIYARARLQARSSDKSAQAPLPDEVPCPRVNPFGRLHPGDRMPDVRLADGTRLFEQMRAPTHGVRDAEGDTILIRLTGLSPQSGMQPVRRSRGDLTHPVDALELISSPHRRTGLRFWLEWRY